MLQRLGVVQHGIVSIITSMYLSGYYQLKGDRTIDCIKIMVQGLTNAEIESQIKISNIFAMDRGYQGTEVASFIVEKGGKLIGTHKRTLGFPFTFAAKKVSEKQKGIEEKGHLCTFWAKSKVGKQNMIQYAACYRNGLGRVALLYTTIPTLGPGKT
jgi:hypothetical protein